ncbi:hypothetical protein MY9_0211 [Bacillus sp. JS]|nr:hypothetical protein MY9_0211 [Bacillus sp. JS]
MYITFQYRNEVTSFSKMEFTENANDKNLIGLAITKTGMIQETLLLK